MADSRQAFWLGTAEPFLTAAAQPRSLTGVSLRCCDSVCLVIL